MPGRYFDEWQVGDMIAHAITRTVTETDNVLISTLTHNPQPLHLDHEAAAPHPSRRTLAELALRPASGHKRTCGGKGRRRLSDICPPARQTVRCKQSFETRCFQRP